jgi:putative transposase
MEVEFCVRALKSALKLATPDIHNSDQGAQYTSNEYLSTLQTNQIQISMDGRGRYLDNIFVERLWRSVKYEDIYLKQYKTITAVYDGLTQYFPFYNQKRRHQGLKDKTPEQVYVS